MNTSAFLLAAGRGERMRPLTDHTPKPLLSVRGKPLIDWALDRLAQAQVDEVWVNTAWLGDQIEAHRARAAEAGEPAKPAIRWSREGADFGHALETAGGIARALPYLPAVFWVAAADVWAPDFHFEPACVHQFQQSQALAHIWLVPNPTHHPQGDFALSAEGLVSTASDNPGARLTYSTMGLFRRELFQAPWVDIPPGNPSGQSAALGPLLKAAAAQGKVTGAIYTGAWVDVGTPERLHSLNESNT